MAPFGVKVVCIEPGLFRTNLFDPAIVSKSTKMVWDRMPQEVKDDYGIEYLRKSMSEGPPTLSLCIVHLISS